MPTPANASNTYKQQIADIAGIHKNALHEGCVADGSTDNASTINTILTSLGTTGGTLHFPYDDTGIYNYSATLTINSATDLPIRITSDPGVVLHATTDTIQDINILSDNVTIENIKMTSNSSVRGSALHNHRILVNGIDGTADNCTIRNVHIDGGKASGIYNRVTDGLRVIDCLIENTLADGCLNFGSTNVLISNCRGISTGDDFIAFTGQANNTQVPSGNVVNCRSYQSGAAGFAVWGGRNILFSNCYAEDSDGSAFRAIAGTSGGTEYQAASNITFSECHSYNNQLSSPSSVGAFYVAAGANTFDTGTATSGSSGDVLEDTGATTWISGNLVGCLVQNTTDGSEGVIYANTTTTITAKLSGGTANVWASTNAYVIIPMASNITFNGCTAQYSYYEHVLITGNATYKNVRDITVTNSRFSGHSNDTKNSIYAANCKDLTITNNRIRDPERAGIYVETNVAGNVIVTGNVVLNPNLSETVGADGIHCVPTATLVVADNIVSDADARADELIAVSSLYAGQAGLPVPEYTVAGVPSAATYDNCIIIVSNEIGGRTLATSDGTNWRRVSDGAVIS